MVAHANLPVALPVDRKKVYDSQNNAWRQKADKIMSSMGNMLRLNVLTRHDIGELIRELAGDESKYGESAVHNLAIVLDEGAGTLWAYRQFALTYTRKQVEELLLRSTKRGHMLAWSHVRLLSSVESPKVRKQMENNTIDKRLSAEDLSRLIQRVRGKKLNTGKTHAPPRSPIAGLGQINKMASDMLAKADMWSESIGHYEHANAEEAADDEVTALEDTVSNLQRVNKTVSTMLDHASNALESAKRRRASKKPAAKDTNGHAKANGHAAVKLRQRFSSAATLGGGKKPLKKAKKRKLQRV